MTLLAADVMGFAGSMAAGVDQAGFDIIAKREPSKFNGFGMESFLYNMPWVDGQVAPADEWELPAEPVDLVYGCPPCSGFSQLSSVNTKVYEHTGTTYRGADAEINVCMEWFVDYVARAKPKVAIMESVGPAFKLGRDWMESLWSRLRDRSGLDYDLTHVNMNASLVGGDVIRPRYFFVAHLQPFGVGLNFVEPRPMGEVLADLGDEEEDDTDWGHRTRRTRSTERITETIRWLQERGRDWEPGTRLPQNTEGLEPPEMWMKPANQVRPVKREGFDPRVYSHWYSTDPFSPVRWRADKPFGVIVAASLDRAIHPTAPRPLTFREAARLMSIPDTWSMRVLVERNRPDELGKAVPSASAKWVAHWAKMSIEGTPGEYAGYDTEVPGVRVIQVQRQKEVDAILDSPDDLDVFHPPATVSDPDPALWLIDRKARPDEWWQRDDELGIFLPKPGAARTSKPKPGTTRRAQSATARRGASTIERVAPEVVQAFLDELGLTKQQAAEKLGVSVSRIGELVGNHRPNSHLNADRWESVQEALRS